MRTIPKYSALSIFLLFLLLVLPASAGYVWENITVDTIDGAAEQSSFTSLAFDDDGYPAISYQYRNGIYDLKYAWKDANGWHNTTVDAEGAVGYSPSLAFNEGYPAISYGTTQDLKYAWKDAGGWHNTTVDAAKDPLEDFGDYTSLAFNGSSPAIGYYDNYHTSLKYAWKDAGVWHNTTVDNSGWVGAHPSLAFDGIYPAISYWDDSTNDNLKYAWKDAGGWHNTTVDSAGEVGTWTSLAFDNDGHPAISYYDTTNEVLKYAWENGGVWQNITIDDTGDDVGKFTSLAFDTDGNPAISYSDGPLNMNLKYAWRDAGVWKTTTVDAAGWVGTWTSLAFDTDDNPAISYFDRTNRNLKYAFRIPVGTINVTSAPAGAAVWLDGVETGTTTPADLTDVPVGMHNVTVVLDSYLPGINDSVEVIFDETTGVAFSLTPVPGNLTITSDPEDAWIWLNGVNTTEQTNTTLAGIVPGTYNVTVQKQGYETPANETMTVVSGDTENFAFTLIPLPPVANFTADPVTGGAPLTVQFNDTSSGVVDTWHWDFGDGANSTGQNPSHTYGTGTYTVALTVENSAGNDTVVKTDFITAVHVVRPSGKDDDDTSLIAFDRKTGTLLTSSEGKVLRTTEITSDDTIATLTLPQGAVALNGDGEPLTSTTIVKVNASGTPPVPDGATFSFAGSAYECGPAGATFAPPITLTFTLSAEEWKTLGGDLSVRFYDDATGTWMKVPVTVDPSTHTVTATISHFSVFALCVEAPGETTPEAGTTVAATPTPTAVETNGGENATGPKPTETQKSPLGFAPFLALGVLLVLGKRQ